MNCWACGFPNLIWGGDHDADDDVYEIETNLSVLVVMRLY